MLTLFATPKPFHGHIGVIQRNAIASWLRLDPGVEVILFGEQEGTAGVCREFGCRHEPSVAHNEFGTPLLGDFFGRAQQIARHPWMVYSNCDIILMQDYVRAYRRCQQWRDQFLLVGRRWDLDITEPLDFSPPDWEQQLAVCARRDGRQRSAEWIDYLAFPRGMVRDIPAFAVGRPVWDNYFLWSIGAEGIPVVDATPAVTAVHQNHDYAHHPQGQLGVWQGEEFRRNFALSGGRRHHHTVEDATWHLTETGVVPNRLAWLAPSLRAVRRLANRVRTTGRVYIKHPLLNLTRPLRHRIGRIAGRAQGGELRKEKES